ncbi:lactonase family protein [Burkholderia multivorans]|uniref:lactonase family protein n=1 Tax=Burkholderia multivorans TaxID=87883 RepID=UPI001C22EC62|nr:beta-propeller fold lactonase family protein [Burkholderia multivorans]MBU9205429.1 lactonase family protein [Burkholderia multivorans]MCO8353438.1 beta-propeller fold lactonase family protein [Burkholderia multivorans]MCO8385697.1 beta-propeller fold lactonase family protein [Burkholderia multivorans]MCO8406622.1 beta-propeller fold lactonase family protein [Burkholderia multivorans]MCO8434793.1 beta-propeller fold lactonase family protein [Burkholderia multivorans]
MNDDSQSAPPLSGGAPSRLVCFVGCYGSTTQNKGGGIHVFDVGAGGAKLVELSCARDVLEAGYLVYAPGSRTLYAVDERKTDGRGPVGPAARVHAFGVDPRDGHLTWKNSRPAPGPFPTFLDLDEAAGALVTANHGSFVHVERVVQRSADEWVSEFVYDDSTVILYGIEDDGSVGRIRDLKILSGHGMDPNHSPQNGGHAQSSAHAHCAVIDPSGRFVLVCDKGTDRIFVYSLGATLELVSTYQFPPEVGPRHAAFDLRNDRVFVTCEFSSELASFAFDHTTGGLTLLDRCSTVAADYSGLNEPAEVRVHPHANYVYVNNRGEDSIAWFSVDGDGRPGRAGSVSLAKSLHPGLAARSFAFDPSGAFLLLADRPANLVRSYAVNACDGSLRQIGDASVLDPAFVAFAELAGEGPNVEKDN